MSPAKLARKVSRVSKKKADPPGSWTRFRKNRHFSLSEEEHDEIAAIADATNAPMSRVVVAAISVLLKATPSVLAKAVADAVARDTRRGRRTRGT